jgi:hypothetical protein
MLNCCVQQCFKLCCVAFIRFSYGPPMSNLEKGVQNMEKMIEYWKLNSESIDEYGKESFGA